MTVDIEKVFQEESSAFLYFSNGLGEISKLIAKSKKEKNEAHAKYWTDIHREMVHAMREIQLYKFDLLKKQQNGAKTDQK